MVDSFWLKKLVVGDQKYAIFLAYAGLSYLILFSIRNPATRNGLELVKKILELPYTLDIAWQTVIAS